MRFVVSLLFVAGAWRAAEGRRGRDVLSTQGRARGYFAPSPPHFAYLGLPYAATTTRFKAPEPPPRWDGIFEATHRVKCPQHGAGDDSCLVVNVFAPEHASALPVLVLVHDAQSQDGWGPHKPSSKLLNQGFVIVTFNYRLGPMGFLCLKIPEAPGNTGLKDQVSALYWVQRNIAVFGGDPSDVTVYGVGSGAADVQILLLSGLARGLFHKVILESGSVLSPTSLTYEPLKMAFNVAQKLGYKLSNDPEMLVKFFQKVPLRRLTNVSEVFLPCIERGYYYSHNLLDEDPVDILKKGNFQDVPMIIAYSNTDGISVVERNKEHLNYVPEHFETLLPNNLQIDDEQKMAKIAELVKEFYFGGVDGSFIENYADYFHCVLSEFPIVKFANLYAARSAQPVYIMKFIYKSDRQMKEMSINNENIIDFVYSDELSEKDETVAYTLITLFCNFIKLGDPTPITTSMVPVIWKAVGEGSEGPPSIRNTPILHFSSTLTMTTTRNSQQLSFWDHVYENFYRSHSPNEEIEN